LAAVYYYLQVCLTALLLELNPDMSGTIKVETGSVAAGFSTDWLSTTPTPLSPNQPRQNVLLAALEKSHDSMRD